MKIKEIQLIDFRLFIKEKVSLHPDINVFFGCNAAGKTALLDAIAYASSRYFTHCSTPDLMLSSKSFPVLDIRCWTEAVVQRNRTALKRHYATESSIGITFDYQENQFSWTLQRTHKTSKLKDANKDAMELARRIKASTMVPILCYYGPHRGALQGDKKRFHRHKLDGSNPFAAYFRGMEPTLDFGAFLEWISDEIAAEKEDVGTSYALDAVRSALKKILVGQNLVCSNPRFEYRPKRFVMNCHHKNQPDQENVIEFDQLSDGYRSMIALVCDIARRLAIANVNGNNDPLDGTGIILIDELDVHLHPSWQSTVLNDLKTIFPNIQFIVTTHSPLILGSVSRENIFTYQSSEDGKNIITPIKDDSVGLNYNEILAILMGVDPIADTPINQQLAGYARSVQDDQHLTAVNQALRQELLARLGEMHPAIQFIKDLEEDAELRALINNSQ